MLDKEFYTTKEIVQMFNINRQTLHRWRCEGIVKYQNIGKRKFIYKKSDIEKMLGNTSTNNTNKKNVIYCRVSNQKQKNDLQKQKQILIDYCNTNGFVVDEIYCEIASGMNENREEFNKMVTSVLNNEIANIFVTYKDRLTRFGYEYFETIFNHFDCKINVLNNKINEENFERELTEDIISLVNSCSTELDSNCRKKLKEIQNALSNTKAGE